MSTPVKYNSFQPCTYIGLNYKTPLRSVVDLWANVLPFKLSRKLRVESSFQDGCYSSLLSSSASRRNLLDVVRTALVELGCSSGLLPNVGRHVGLALDGQPSSNLDVRRGCFPTSADTSAWRWTDSDLFCFETLVLCLRRSTSGRISSFSCYEDLRHCCESLVIFRRFDRRRHRPTRSSSSIVVSGKRPVARFDVIVYCHVITHEYT